MPVLVSPSTLKFSFRTPPVPYLTATLSAKVPCGANGDYVQSGLPRYTMDSVVLLPPYLTGCLHHNMQFKPQWENPQRGVTATLGSATLSSHQVPRPLGVIRPDSSGSGDRLLSSVEPNALNAVYELVHPEGSLWKAETRNKENGDCPLLSFSY